MDFTNRSNNRLAGLEVTPTHALAFVDQFFDGSAVTIRQHHRSSNTEGEHEKRDRDDSDPLFLYFTDQI